MIFEVGATCLGVVQGFLAMLNKRSNWIFYILEMLFLIVFSLINHLYGDVVNNNIYLVMGVVGFIIWNKNNEANKITVCSKRERIVYVLIMLIGKA